MATEYFVTACLAWSDLDILNQTIFQDIFCQSFQILVVIRLEADVRGKEWVQLVDRDFICIACWMRCCWYCTEQTLKCLIYNLICGVGYCREFFITLIQCTDE